MGVIRILHVLGRLDRGGAETLVMNWYRNIDRSKIQFDFVIHTKDKCSYNDEIVNFGGKIYSISRFNGRNYKEYKKSWNTFFLNHPEYKIVHGHVRSTAAIYMNIAKKYNCITIAHSHAINSGNGIQGKVKDVMQIPIRLIADYKWACSEEAARYLFGKKSLQQENTKIIRNAIDVQSFTYNESVRNLYRNKFDLSDSFVIGHIGRFIPEKNHQFIINVFNEVNSLCDNAKLLLVGTGPLFEHIYKLIKSLDLTEKVIILKDRNDVNCIIQAMDIFVFPSKAEGLGIAAVEAQTSGITCLISDYVPKAAKLTEHTYFLPIDEKKDVKKWGDEIICEYKMQRERTDVSDIITNAGYDIVIESHKLMDEYRKILRETKD